MPKRNLTATQIWVHPKQKPKDLIPLDAIPDQDGEKHDYLHLFHGFIQEVRQDHLHDSGKEQWTSVLDIPEPKGRTVSVATEAGKYGEEGSGVDIGTGLPAFKYDSNHSIQVTTHGVLFVPHDSPYAILFQERSGGRCGAGRIHEIFVKAFKKTFPKLMVKTAAVLESEAWIQAAELMEIEVMVTHPSTDEANFDIPSLRHATFSYNIHPSKEKKSLPRRLYDDLMGRNIKPEDLVSLTRGAETGATFVTFAKDGRRKSFELHHQNEPVASILLSKAGEDAPTQHQVYARCIEEASEYFPRMGVEWKEKHVQGRWDKDQLAIRTVMPDDEQT